MAVLDEGVAVALPPAHGGPAVRLVARELARQLVVRIGDTGVHSDTRRRCDRPERSCGESRWSAIVVVRHGDVLGPQERRRVMLLRVDGLPHSPPRGFGKWPNSFATRACDECPCGCQLGLAV